MNLHFLVFLVTLVFLVVNASLFSAAKLDIRIKDLDHRGAMIALRYCAAGASPKIGCPPSIWIPSF